MNKLIIQMIRSLKIMGKIAETKRKEVIACKRKNKQSNTHHRNITETDKKETNAL